MSEALGWGWGLPLTLLCCTALRCCMPPIRSVFVCMHTHRRLCATPTVPQCHRECTHAYALNLSNLPHPTSTTLSTESQNAMKAQPPPPLHTVLGLWRQSCVLLPGNERDECAWHGHLPPSCDRSHFPRITNCLGLRSHRATNGIADWNGGVHCRDALHTCRAKNRCTRTPSRTWIGG
jgi:hypothetical protein